MSFECIFCKIIEGEVKSELLYEDNEIVAFRDIEPVAPVHILVVPKEHIARLSDAKERHTPLLGNCLAVLNKLAVEHLQDVLDGFRMVVNCGPAAGQGVWHLHFHLVGGRKLLMDI